MLIAKGLEILNAFSTSTIVDQSKQLLGLVVLDQHENEASFF